MFRLRLTLEDTSYILYFGKLLKKEKVVTFGGAFGKPLNNLRLSKMQFSLLL